MDIEQITTQKCGASFLRGDLHIHSFGGSFDVADSSATAANIVNAAAVDNVQIISITDHNEIENVAGAIVCGDARGVLVIPGVELSTPEGHLLCYAPTLDALTRFFAQVSIVDRRTKHSRCQTGMADCLTALEAQNGFGVIAHLEKAGSFEANCPRFTPAKFDILCHRALLGFEVTNSACPILYTDVDPDADRRRAAQKRISDLGLGSHQFLARILNSDAHTLSAVGRNARSDQRITRYKMGAASFDGLRVALTEADTRVRIEDEVPLSVPTIEGVHFSGGFLDGQAIRFSPNLTCIIGGRGSGKSTTFEALRLIGDPGSPEAGSVIDSDVWPEMMTLAYRDETNARHVLGRNKGCVIENLDDSINGSRSFPVETYRQGETNEISKRVQTDPMTLLTVLDRLHSAEQDIAIEDGFRTQLLDLSTQVLDEVAAVEKIPAMERELKLTQGKLGRLKKQNAEGVIELQERLQAGQVARNTIELELRKLETAISKEPVTTIVRAIRESASSNATQPGTPETSAILASTSEFEIQLSASTGKLEDAATKYALSVRSEIDNWKAKESLISAAVDKKKAELLAHDIRLDMPFIRSLVRTQARTTEKLNAAKAKKLKLVQLQQRYAELQKQRWAARKAVAAQRKAFASRATTALKGTLSDLFVTLKFKESSLSPQAKQLIIEVMNWRTNQQLKAGVLVKDLTIPCLLDCIYNKNTAPILALKNAKEQAYFNGSEAQVLVERLAATDVLWQLETVAVHDLPRLTVTKRLAKADGSSHFVPRDFRRLSLGQQQSVLLALMLTSESSAPLVIDQPEDNLDSVFIYNTLVPAIRRVKERRQVIVVTHNANIAVLGDAEQLVVLKATHDKAIITERGSIDEPATREAACAILEGSRQAFERRTRIYGSR